MEHEEFRIKEGIYDIATSLKTPQEENGIGVVGIHGLLINKESLSRKDSDSLGTDLSRRGFYFLTYDDVLHGNTKTSKPKNQVRTEDSTNLANIAVDYLSDMGLEVNVFGHSRGGNIAANVSNNKKIKAISTFGTPEMTYFPMAALMNVGFKILSKLPLRYLNMLPLKNDFEEIPTKSFFSEIIFDKETLDYYDDVMEKDKGYKTDNHPTTYPVKYMADLINQKTFKPLLDSGKPTKVIFGTSDKVTSKMLKFPYFRDGSEYRNISVAHIDGGHITPNRKDKAYGKVSDILVPFYTETLV